MTARTFLQHSAVSGGIVVLGIAAACLSTALGSMFGSSRIMQAIARDGIYPWLRVFAKGSVEGDEPRRALVLSCAEIISPRLYLREYISEMIFRDGGGLHVSARVDL
jgi:amino acid transporter